MAKAIVRVNAFLSEKQMKDVYNLIYDQVKAGLEVITVPAYCDVYVLNGADIEVQKKECTSCKHYMIRAFDTPPCGYCNDHNKWEAKDNG